MVDNTYLNNFEETLTAGLKKICASAGLIDGELFWTPDFDTKWEEYIKEYVADAVSNFNEFPEAAIAWSAYLGLGVAHVWILTNSGSGPIADITVQEGGMIWMSTSFRTS